MGLHKYLSEQLITIKGDNIMTTLTIILGITVLVGVGFYLTNKSDNNSRNSTSSGGGSSSSNDKDVNVK